MIGHLKNNATIINYKTIFTEKTDNCKINSDIVDVM